MQVYDDIFLISNFDSPMSIFVADNAKATGNIKKMFE